MRRACAWVRNNGGAERVNVFTRILLATFGQVPWRTVPAMPAEIIWMPGWWFFSLAKVSYWSRCVIVPLLLIFSFRPVPRGTAVGAGVRGRGEDGPAGSPDLAEVPAARRDAARVSGW